MNNSIITIDNVKGYIGENNLIYLNLEDVARGLGFVDIKNNVEYVRWTRVRKYLEYTYKRPTKNWGNIN